MNKTKSQAESFLKAYETFQSNGASRSPDWLRNLRSQAIDHFSQQGFPHTKLEEWRLTNVQPIAETSFALSPESGEIDGSAIERLLLDEATPRIVTLNGRFSAALSNLDGVGGGVWVGGLETAVLEGVGGVENNLGQHTDLRTNPFAALGTAFVRDGAFVYVPAGVELDRPVQVIHLFTAAAEPVMSHPRTLIVLAENAKGDFVEMYATVGRGEVQLTNAVTEVVVAEGAGGSCTRLALEEDNVFHIANTTIHQSKDSAFTLTCLAIGGGLTRHDIVSVLNGEGAENTLNGLYMPEGRQHVDFHTTLDHAKPNCNSYEFFNGILSDQSRAVFSGRIIVREGAQKTDSKQTNNNLLLSERARADSQPQLEIYADDVRCTHGATLGPLDDSAAFYLQSRGLSREVARKLMTYGFAGEVIERVNVEPVRRLLDAIVKARLDKMMSAVEQ